MRRKKNIILNSRNITPHFTGKEKIITLVSIIIMLSFVNIINTSALSYQTETGIKFTFNPTINISLSDNLTITNLTPGTTADSNIINVSVVTNTSYGYTISALASSDSLIHSNNTNTFNNIATNANLESLTTDNTWGYSYKNNMVSAVWSNYNGLPTTTNKILYDTDNVTSSSIDFKIAAKASNTQPSGTYTNTINFYAVAKPTPQTIDDLTYLQGFANLSPTDLQSVKNSMPVNHTYTLKDQRDEQEYTIAKLADGKIWMTKNLNLAGGTEITAELSDIPEGYILPTENGFQEGNRLPESSNGWTANFTKAYIYNTKNNTDACNNGCYSYYSWHAATVGSGINIITDNTDASYSICPKGWKMPNTRSGTEDNSTDFRSLMLLLGGSLSISKYDNSTIPTGENLYNQLLQNPLKFSLAGYTSGTIPIKNGGSYGEYWTSTVENEYNSYSFALYNGSTVDTAEFYRNYYGYSVRCLAK